MRSRVPRRLGDEAGITLTETLVVIAILGVVIGSLTIVFSAAIRTSSQVQEQSTQQTEARAAVDQLVREVRQAYSGDSTVPVVTATGTTLEILSPDFQAPFHLRRIAYRLASGKLQRAITTSTSTGGPPWTGWAWSSFAGIPANAWATKLEDVRNPAAFTYFSPTGAQLTGAFSLASIERIVATVTVSTTAQPNRTYTYSQSASMRWTPE